jgi:uncharacterized protein
MTNNRFVIDTNVIVSALIFPSSPPRLAFNKVYDAGKILASRVTILELEEVVNRKKFDKYISKEKRIQFIAKFFDDVEIIEIVEPVIACRDRKDDKFLELAVNGSADCIVTGDQDLLVLHPFRNINIISPNEFLQSWI